MKINNPTFGSDFEMFLKNKEGKYISAVGIIGGTKKKPLSIGEGCFRQVDNVMGEFNIPPVTTLKDWNYYLEYCIYTVQKEILDKQGLELVAESAVYMSKDQLRSKSANTFGCEPSWNAWEGGTYHPTKPESTLRTAGFHVHVGFKYEHIDDLSLDDVFEFIKYCDLYLGLPSILIEPANPRRELYGKAGDCRAKDIAEQNLVIVEYRSLGGWMFNHKDWVFNQLQAAIEAYNNKTEELPEVIKDAINENNIELTKQIVNDFNIKLPEYVSSTINA